MKRFIPAFLSLVSLCLTLACPEAPGKQLVDRTVVTINNDVILESDIDRFQKKLKPNSYQEMLGSDGNILKNRDTVLQLLVEEKLIDQQVKKLDLLASDQEI